jgi:hypothetical protein
MTSPEKVLVDEFMKVHSNQLKTAMGRVWDVEDVVCPECGEETTQEELDNFGGVDRKCYQVAWNGEDETRHPDDHPKFVN